MSKYSEKKKRQAEAALAERKSTSCDAATTRDDQSTKITRPLIVAVDSINTALEEIQRAVSDEKGSRRSDLSAAKGRLVSARDKLYSALSRFDCPIAGHGPRNRNRVGQEPAPDLQAASGEAVGE